MATTTPPTQAAPALTVRLRSDIPMGIEGDWVRGTPRA